MQKLPAFEPPQTVGCYCWSPKDLSRKKFCDVTAHDVLRGLQDADQVKPDQIAQLHSISMPQSFEELPRQLVPNGFPYDAGYIVPLYMAKHWGIDLQKVDFLLGGSALNVFATRKIERGARDDTKYYVQKCPGTGVTLVCKSKTYTSNYADIGFQFERLVTGQPMRGQHDLRKFENLQLMQIGGLTVLFSAEVDAVNGDGCPVEIKSGNPHNLGMKVMFQMLSSGSKTLVMANKQGKQLQGIKEVSIDDVIGWNTDVALKRAEDNIVQALTELKHSTMVNADAPIEMDFDRRSLVLIPCTGADLLPSREVVEELINA